jgi:GTP-binding protein
VLVVLDGEAGLVPGDLDVVQSVRALGKPMVAVVNKTDVRVAREAAVQFFELGLNPIVEISAEHGSGVDDLLDEVVRRLPPSRGARKAQPRDAGAEGDGAEDIAATPELKEIGIAIVGRPNAGKSSLVNRLLREERMVVSDVPGTTRDAVDVVLRWHRRTFRIVDTAGIRRPGRVSRSGALESLSVMVARRAIERADVVVLLIDATVGATDQDAAIAGEADKAGCGVIIAANKWDLMKDRGPDFSKGFDETVRRQLKFLDWAPVMHISAASGERTPRLLEMIDRVAESRRKRVGTGELNRFVAEVTAEHPPASPGRREVRIMYAAQTAVAPPTFVFFTNVATNFHFSYERFLQNRLRDAFGFLGTPIRIHVRRRAGRTKKA